MFPCSLAPIPYVNFLIPAFPVNPELNRFAMPRPGHLLIALLLPLLLPAAVLWAQPELPADTESINQANTGSSIKFGGYKIVA